MSGVARVGVAVLVACAAALTGCPRGTVDDGGIAATDASDSFPGDANTAPVFAHTVGPITLAAGEEQANTCASWTLGNDTTVYVQSVEMHSLGGMHHSNWYFVPPSLFDGPDGLWNCTDRGFDSTVAAMSGGVLFAQSTQSLDETEQFPPGAVIAIPPHARIAGQIHLVNATGAPLTTQQQLVLHTIPEREVTVRLSALVIEYTPLQIPPHSTTRFTVTCDLASEYQRVVGRPLDLAIYHGLPHYHALGVGLEVSIAGGARDGQSIQQTTATLGEPVGRVFDPPVDLTGATGLTLSCTYVNPTDNTVTWGNAADEMCLWDAYTDSAYFWKLGALFGTANTVTGTDGGVTLNTAPCSFAAITTSTRDW